MCLTFSSFASSALVTETYSCKLDSSDGVFRSFEVSVDRVAGLPLGSSLQKTHSIKPVWNYRNYDVATSHLLNYKILKNDEDKMITFFLGASEFRRYTVIDFMDWGYIDIVLDSNEIFNNRAYAFVELFSIDFAVTGFYTCRKK